MNQAQWLVPAAMKVSSFGGTPRQWESQWCAPWIPWQRPTRLDVGLLQHRAGVDRHRVGVVEQPRVRAELLHLAAEADHHRDGPQAPEYAADAESVGDGLLEAVLLRHLEVGDGAGLVEADLDGVDDVVGALERFLAVRLSPMIFAGAPSLSATLCARISAVRRRSGSMSIRAISESASSGNWRMSPSRLRVKTQLPAPMNVIFGKRRSSWSDDREIAKGRNRERKAHGSAMGWLGRRIRIILADSSGNQSRS